MNSLQNRSQNYNGIFFLLKIVIHFQIAVDEFAEFNVLNKYGITKNAQRFLVNTIAENINFRKFLEEKISDFSSEEAEEVFKKFAKKEMKFIEISGAVLGFIIGLIQSLILFFSRYLTYSSGSP